MSDFLQVHLLTSHAPSNLNRDDSGRPKSAEMGGVPRLRISSQSLKRAWRTSEVFQDALQGHLAKRTARMGEAVLHRLLDGGMEESEAVALAREVAGIFGKPKAASDDHPTARTEQLAFVSPEEEKAVLAIADDALSGKEVSVNGKDILQKADTAVDVAMFGRMLAANPAFNREAAVQVAHAITTHRGLPEDDYYTAVDDLKSREDDDDSGAGFVGVAEFGAGVFYLYVCIDRDLLVRNLGGNASLAHAGIAALIEAMATVTPSGKQASFASRARAIYALAERGASQPRSLAAAFVKPVNDRQDFAAGSIRALEAFRDNLDRVYGACAESHYRFNVLSGEGSLAEMIAFSVGEEASVE